MRKYVRMIIAFITTIAMMMASGTTVNAAGWKQDGKGWWFENTDGTYVSNTWKQVNGKWYAFDSQGYMRTGWFQENGKWYYLDNLGAMQTGWVKENEKWYYMGADGACFINTMTPDGYMVDANGVYLEVNTASEVKKQYDVYLFRDGRVVEIDGKCFINEFDPLFSGDWDVMIGHSVEFPCSIFGYTIGEDYKYVAEYNGVFLPYKLYNDFDSTIYTVQQFTGEKIGEESMFYEKGKEKYYASDRELILYSNMEEALAIAEIIPQNIRFDFSLSTDWLGETYIDGFYGPILTYSKLRDISKHVYLNVFDKNNNLLYKIDLYSLGQYIN